MQQTLTETFHDSAKAARETFPERLVNFVLLLDTKQTPVYASPEIVNHLTRSVNIVKRAVGDVGKTMVRLNAIGLAYPYYKLGSKYSKLIALREDPPGLYYPRFTPEMRAVYVLAHEIGHHVVKNGLGLGHLGESAADAFAALRHIQRFGRETDYFKFSTKAYQVVLGTSPIHYTANVFDRVKALSSEKDIENLSLKETAELAAQVAQENHYDSKTLNKLTRAFQGAASVYLKTYGTRHKITDMLYAKDKDAYALFVRETVKVLRNNAEDDDVLLAGQRFLSYPALKRFIKKGAGSSPELQEALDFLKLDMQFTPTKPAMAVPRTPATSRSSAPTIR
ncbi:MAG: hypothetical protein Q8K65_01640 [Alphaproteobacteria bacterium]|nr:hypothetical protein [Alphaproteobacteria bacterium]